jgi:hypothetical protein
VTRPLTPIQIRALAILRDKGPLLSACAGEQIWPDRKFKSRQGAGFSGGGILGKLDKSGLVTVEYRRADASGRSWPKGWALTSKGRSALAKACTALVNSKHDEAMKMADEERWAEACVLEREAAEVSPHVEPTRSVLFRSAGNLAVSAGLHDVALRMARSGLNGYPPAPIKAELEELEKVARKVLKDG